MNIKCKIIIIEILFIHNIIYINLFYYKIIKLLYTYFLNIYIYIYSFVDYFNISFFFFYFLFFNFFFIVLLILLNALKNHLKFIKR